MKIRDPDYAEKLRRTIATADPRAPFEISEELVLAVLDLSNFLPVEEMLAKPVQIIGGGGGRDETGTGELFTTDPADTVNQTQDVTQIAGGSGVFSAAGFKVAARGTLPTRIDIVDFFLRPSVDCQIGIAFENFTAAFAGKALVGGAASARSGAVDKGGTGGTKRATVAGGAEANVRWWVPFHAANTVFRWQPPNPEFRLSPGAIPEGLRVACVADVTNTAIRVQWGVIWRQVPTP